MNNVSLLKALVEAWHGGACLIDSRRILIHSNELLRRWMRAEQQDLKGVAAESLFTLTRPFLDQPVVQGVLLRPGGSILEIELTSLPVDLDGETLHVLFMNDITDRQRAEKERKELTHRLLEIQEDERKEISSLLHDQLGQILTLIRLELQSIVPKDSASKQHIESCTSHTLSLLETVRGLARSLRPSILDDLPIENALEDLVEEFDRSMEPRFTFTLQAKSDIQMDRDRQTSIYRILQESLQNAARHSGADRVDTFYTAETDGITLSVVDNGTGFSHTSMSPPESIGLIGIRERLARTGGFLKITSHAGDGSRLDAFMPYENN